MDVDRRLECLVNPRDATALYLLAEDAAGNPVLARRARIVLLCEQGMAPHAVAWQMGCSRQTVVTWLERYRAEGIDGLRDAPRPGRPARLNPAAVVVRTLQTPGGGRNRWSTRRLAAEFGISNVTVANVWRQWGIRPEPGGRVALLTEPVLDTVINDVLGLFISRSMILFAVTVGEARRHPGTAIGLGRVASDRLADLATQQGRDDPPLPTDFLDQLEQLLCHRGSQDLSDHAGRSASARLLVWGDETTRHWALTQDTIAAHVIPSHLRDRIVRVGCLIAGADENGAASVNALRAAITEHDDREVFAWLRTADEPPQRATR